MSELKYVVTEHGDFAIFTKLTSHSDVRGLHGKGVGAGFCNIAVGYKRKWELGEEERIVNVYCYGRSTSLDLAAREEDEAIIYKAFSSETYG